MLYRIESPEQHKYHFISVGSKGTSFPLLNLTDICLKTIDLDFLDKYNAIESDRVLSQTCVPNTTKRYYVFLQFSLCLQFSKFLSISLWSRTIAMCRIRSDILAKTYTCRTRPRGNSLSKKPRGSSYLIRSVCEKSRCTSLRIYYH